MQTRPLGRSGLQIAPLVFGGNVFGWTADEATSFRLLDTFADAGLNAIDTADVYSRWAPGHAGGESETIIGKWLAQNPARRDQMVIISKVGSDMGQGKVDLSAGWIEKAVEDSLRRLQVEAIDLYFAHWHDPATPYAETLGAFDRLLKAGKIRAIGASNHDASQLRAALDTAADENLPRYSVLQPEYNLYDRSSFDGPLRDLCMAEDIGVITYFSLAKGFLSGKYRGPEDLDKSTRGRAMGIETYFTPRGFAILTALDDLAADHKATPAEIALAWIMAREGVTAPIASATSLTQLQSLIAATKIDLGPADIATLDSAGA